MSPDKARRLGRGLEALIASPATGDSNTTDRTAIERVAIGAIRPNPYQPRKEFRQEDLAELEASLRSNGLLQPIAVRRAPGGHGYELIAGERRLRAATQLGWSEIPAVVRDIDDRTLLTLALIENLQRADLNPMEEAEGYQRLIGEFGLTQQQVGEMIGKNRSTVANMLRLLNLPASVRRLIQDGQLTLGHARALLAIGNEGRMVELAREVVAKGLTVRDVEQRSRVNSGGERARRNKVAGSSPEARRFADELRRHLQTDVTISLTEKTRGRIVIAFYAADDLDRLLGLILGQKREQL